MVEPLPSGASLCSPQAPVLPRALDPRSVAYLNQGVGLSRPHLCPEREASFPGPCDDSAWGKRVVHLCPKSVLGTHEGVLL